MPNEEYVNSILKWRKEVDTNLRRENGWLALAGLFWLRKGTNLIGSDPSCDIKLPSRAPKKLGRFEFDGNNVTLYVETERAVEVNGMETKTALLDADQEDVPSFITMDDMRMVVVRRSKGVGIRLWDNMREERRTFPPQRMVSRQRGISHPQRLITVIKRPRSSRCPTSSAQSSTKKWMAKLFSKSPGKTLNF